MISVIIVLYFIKKYLAIKHTYKMLCSKMYTLKMKNKKLLCEMRLWILIFIICLVQISSQEKTSSSKSIGQTTETRTAQKSVFQRITSALSGFVDSIASSLKNKPQEISRHVCIWKVCSRLLKKKQNKNS